MSIATRYGPRQIALAVVASVAAACVLCTPSTQAKQEAAATTTQTAESLPAEADVLVPGSVAPSLDGLVWVKGEALRTFEADTIYVVDAWATWCMPCEKTIPHLARIANAYRNHNVRVLGVAVWESKVPFPDGTVNQNYEQRLREYASTRAERLTYDIAFDAEGVFERAWMRAGRRVSIPTAFLVDGKGAIAWYGHPLIGMDEALAQLVAGTFDADKAFDATRAREARRVAGMKLASPLQIATREERWQDAIALAGQIFETDREMFSASGVSKLRLMLLHGSEAEAIAFATKERDLIVAKPVHEQAKLLEVIAGFAEGLIDTAGQQASQERQTLSQELAALGQALVMQAITPAPPASEPSENAEASALPPPPIVLAGAGEAVALASVQMRHGHLADATKLLQAAKTLDPDPSQSLQIEMLERQLSHMQSQAQPVSTPR